MQDQGGSSGPRQTASPTAAAGRPQRRGACRLARSSITRREVMRAPSKITGSPLPGWVAAADQVHVAAEAVVRTEIEHLGQVVRQIECSAIIDRELALPDRAASRSFRDRMRLSTSCSPSTFRRSSRDLPESRRFPLPIDGAAQVRERAPARRGSCTLGAKVGSVGAGILHVERGVRSAGIPLVIWWMLRSYSREERWCGGRGPRHRPSTADAA